MISFIIVNYNTKDLTEKAIKSIMNNCNRDEYEIIVFDNASSDGSREFFEKYKGILYIYSHQNLGFAKANNEAFKYAKGKYIYLLNSDAEILTNNACKKVVEKFEKYQDAGILATKVVYPDGSPQPNVQNFSKPITFLLRLLKLGQFVREKPLLLRALMFFPYKPQFVKGYLSNFDKSISEKERYVDWASGCSLVIRREVWEQVGGFDEKFFLYCEDEDFCLRAQRLGYRVLYSPEITVVHHEKGSSMDDIVEFVVTERMLSEIYFLKKHFSKKEYSFILKMARVLSLLLSPFSYRLRISYRVLKGVKT